MSDAPDVARIRFINAMRLFDEFVQATVKSPDAATLRGLERRFAERLQIQPSYWSQIKGGSRQIGERLARQFERLCRKPPGWLDQVGSSDTPSAPEPGRGQAQPSAPTALAASNSHHQPQDDDERFIVGLVLTYYRRHPQRARTRLLDLLGEVLTPVADQQAPRPAVSTERAVKNPATGATATPQAKPAVGKSPDEETALWARSLAGIAPLKRKT